MAMKINYKQKTLDEICSEINNVLEDKNLKKADCYTLLDDLKAAMYSEIDFIQLNHLCEIILKIAKTKNRAIRFFENRLWDEIPHLIYNLIENYDLDLDEEEELKPNIGYDNEAKKMLSRLLQLSYDALSLYDDKGNANKIRREGALKLIGELVEYYIISESKALFLNSIKSNNKQEQYFALVGLENYYTACEEKIDPYLIEILDNLFDETDDDTIASTCLQIKINTGLIDELTASFELGDWKHEHF